MLSVRILHTHTREGCCCGITHACGALRCGACVAHITIIRILNTGGGAAATHTHSILTHFGAF